MNDHRLPGDVRFVRTSPTWTESTVPAGLLSAHRVAEGVWGRLVVRSGTLTLVFEGDAVRAELVTEGNHAVIPPQLPHHVELDGPVEFCVEFLR